MAKTEDEKLKKDLKKKTMVDHSDDALNDELFEEIKTHANVQNKSGKTAEDKGITCDWQKTETTGDPNDYYKNKNYYSNHAKK